MPERKRERVRYYDDQAALGHRLREAREAAGLSQRELSFPGCTAAYISRVEKGDRVPSLQLVREFAHRLGVSERYITHGDDALTDDVQAEGLGQAISPRLAHLIRLFGDVPEYKLRYLAQLSGLDVRDLQMFGLLAQRLTSRSSGREGGGN